MIGISSSWFAIKGMPVQASIEKCFELGFELVEVGAAHKYEDGIVETVLELRKKYTDRAFTLHALFPPFKNGSYALNLADIKEQDRILKVVKKMFDITERLGATVVGIHGGYAGEVEWVDDKFGYKKLEIKKPIPLKTAKRNMILIVEDLVGLAEERNIGVAIEISPSDSSAPMMTNPENFEWLFSNFKSKQLGMLVDTGHLHISSGIEGYNPYEFTKKFKNKIFEVHLHDCINNQDHIAVGTGEIDFERHFKTIGRPKLKKLPMVFEYNSSVSEQQALAGKALVENMLGGKL